MRYRGGKVTLNPLKAINQPSALRARMFNDQIGKKNATQISSHFKFPYMTNKAVSDIIVVPFHRFALFHSFSFNFIFL